MRKALINSSSGEVVNIIKDGPDYTPPEGFEVQDAGEGVRGMIWNGTGYDPKPQSAIDAEERAAVKALAPVIRKLAFNLNKRIRQLEGKPVETQAEINEILRAWIK